MNEKQTGNRRQDGTFALGNKAGKPFKKGVSGNPHGRPKLTAVSEAIRARLAVTLPGKDERTITEWIAIALCDKAMSGDVAAAKEIADRSEGKAKQQMAIDMNVMDWREMAKANGVSEREIIEDARRYIEQFSDDADDA